MRIQPVQCIRLIRVLHGLFTTSIILLLVAPYVIIILFSLGSFNSSGEISYISYNGYKDLFEEPSRFNSIVVVAVRSLINAVIATLVALPFSFLLLKTVRESGRHTVLAILSLPFLINESIRVYSWNAIIGGKGLINNILGLLGWSEQILWLSNSDFAVQLVMLAGSIPLGVFIFSIALMTIDKTIWQASAGFGSSQWFEFKSLVLPYCKKSAIITVLVLLFLGMSSSAESHYFSSATKQSMTVLINDLLSASKIASVLALGSLTMVVIVILMGLIYIRHKYNNRRTNMGPNE